MIQMTFHSENPAREQGFTLVEMAMVLAIVALLLTGLVPTISGQLEQRRSAETKKQLEEIQQALIGFAIINGRLPCPAPQGSGTESPAGGGACDNSYNGVVPGATLGLSSLNENGEVLDGWDNPIRYVVTSWDSTTPVKSDVYTTSSGISEVGLSSLRPNLLVCTTSTGLVETNCTTNQYTTSDCKCATDQALTAGDGVPAIIFSTGKNGAGGGTGADEEINLDNNRIFVSHTPTAAGNPNGEFDDLVIWISNQVLISKMVAAGKLP
jgi:prepilin-type N-terminal cleavage/methylation domain-containing protein